jgi:hypothetical protein
VRGRWHDGNIIVDEVVVGGINCLDCDDDVLGYSGYGLLDWKNHERMSVM